MPVTSRTRDGWPATPSREPLLPTHEDKDEFIMLRGHFKLRHSLTRSLLRYGSPPSVLVTCALLLCVASSVLLISTISKSGSSPLPLDVNGTGTATTEVVCPKPQYPDAKVLDPKAYVLGSPTARFRDNLRNDTKYITSWDAAGWTNDVMALGNMIYLGSITDRIPIIPPFTPSHLSKSAGAINTGDIFDLPRLSAHLQLPLVEWHQVKQSDSEEMDQLGCWSVWEAAHQEADGTRRPRPHRGEEVLKLDISYTRAPDFVAMGRDDHAHMWGLAALGFSEYRSQHLSAPHPSSQSGSVLYPDEQVLCFDLLYYVSVFQPFEYEHEHSPVWRDVVRHMRWTERLEGIAQGYIRRILGVPEGSDIPPFIAIHFRRGDFKVHCPEWKTDGCFATLAMFAQAVSEVQEELWVRKGIRVTEVIMHSDEQDPSWWDEVAALGWKWPDHGRQRTVETYGQWYPVLIDAVIQSSGVGFVGTQRSTMSLLAQKRTEEWQDGVIREVRWG